ncbi:MAG: hypothetical protein WBC71_05605 [Salaquimonas sp.]
MTSSKSSPQPSKRHISRRAILAGSAGAVALTALPSSVFASVGTFLAINGKAKSFEPTLAKFLCQSVHHKIANNLDEVINDPTIDGERTALALMEARCPGCGDRVHPAKSSLSAVIPQWKSPITQQGTSA